jgi:CubicO group peptidase (beta-lactamase class C family)
MKKSYLSVALFLMTSSVASSQEWPWADSVSSGYRSSAKVNYVEPSVEVKKLENNTAINPDVKKIIDDQIKKLPTRALLVGKGNEIFYEYYSSKNASKWTPLGYSMSKSLTAMAVGKAFCEGRIKNLNDPLGMYVTELQGTSWGNSSIKNVLMMSSGSYKTDIRLNGHKNIEIETLLGRPMHTGQMNKDFISIMKEIDQKELKPGDFFYYNNMDTIALGLLVEASTGKKFYKYFEESVWKPSGAESKGAWFANNLNQTSTYQGFSASPHDWLRLGLYVLESRSKADCFGKFLEEGTQKIINTNLGFLPPSYGFQIWVNCRLEVDFCFVGFGRQNLWFNLKKNVVMYHHAAVDRLDESTLWSAYSNILDNIN